MNTQPLEPQQIQDLVDTIKYKTNPNGPVWGNWKIYSYYRADGLVLRVEAFLDPSREDRIVRGVHKELVIDENKPVTAADVINHIYYLITQIEFEQRAKNLLIGNVTYEDYKAE
jgi:hypothetical protein